MPLKQRCVGSATHVRSMACLKLVKATIEAADAAAVSAAGRPLNRGNGCDFTMCSAFVLDAPSLSGVRLEIGWKGVASKGDGSAQNEADWRLSWDAARHAGRRIGGRPDDLGAGGRILVQGRGGIFFWLHIARKLLISPYSGKESEGNGRKWKAFGSQSGKKVKEGEGKGRRLKASRSGKGRPESAPNSNRGVGGDRASRLIGAFAT